MRDLRHWYLCVVFKAARNAGSRKQVAQLLTWLSFCFCSLVDPSDPSKVCLGAPPPPPPPHSFLGAPGGLRHTLRQNVCSLSCKLRHARKGRREERERGRGGGGAHNCVPDVSALTCPSQELSLPARHAVVRSQFDRLCSRVRVVHTAVCQCRWDKKDGQDGHLECLYRLSSWRGSKVKFVLSQAA